MIQEEMLSFGSDYMEGAHPDVMNQLVLTNLVKSPGYGTDSYSAAASRKILAACDCPDGAVYFLSGGTQTNSTVIDALLPSYEGVMAAKSGHISVHEAGAIEGNGHKVLELPHEQGKVKADEVATFIDTLQQDENHDHMVMPGLLYISQPTEYGTLYSLQELTALCDVCHQRGVKVYVDGARLAYALAAENNDVTLRDLARLCDVFYIGGTKCGALFGEAVVLPKADLIPHFFTIIKQHGALFAKGRLLGVQFDTLFTNDLYLRLGKPAVAAAQRMQQSLRQKGYELLFLSPTNQVFVVIENEKMKELAKKVEFSFWEALDETHTIIRFVTSWDTKIADIERLEDIL